MKRIKVDTDDSSFFAISKNGQAEEEKSTLKRKAEPIDVDAEDIFEDIGLMLHRFSEDEKSTLMRAMRQHPEATATFATMLRIFNTKLSSSSSPPSAAIRQEKKKTIPSPTKMASGENVCTVEGLSFVLPRKRLDLRMTATCLSLVNCSTKAVERQVSLAQVERVLCVPTPESRLQNQWSVVLFVGDEKDGQIVFSVSDAPLKIVWETSGSLRQSVEGLKPLDQLKEIFKSLLKAPVTSHSDSTFVSSKKGAYVNSYLKAKEGQLYFLQDGILFGFKKPILFLPLAETSSIGFSNVTSRFFDLNVERKSGGQQDFSMIDQAEFNLISSYVESYNQNKRKEQSTPKKDAKPGTQNKEEEVVSDSDSDDEEGDDDFAPKDADFDPLPEEYDERYGEDFGEEEGQPESDEEHQDEEE